jgi:hypothetical protein
MEDLLTLDLLDQNELLLKSKIFTKLQLGILKKRLQKKALDINEKTYYYKFIKPKLCAIYSVLGIGKYNVRGRDEMLTGRLDKAASILAELEKKHRNQKILISGSFLFNSTYHDIDAFIFTKYQKEDYSDGKIHVNFLQESALESLFFSSLAQISVANFQYRLNTSFDLSIDMLLHDYELLVNSILNKEDPKKELRNLLLRCEYLSRGIILNPHKLYILKEKISNDLRLISNIFINALVLSSCKAPIIQRLKQMVKDYGALLAEYSHANNIQIYLDTYRQVIGYEA